MDVNGTRFHLLFGQRDWLRESLRRSPPGTDPRLEWQTADQTLRLRRLQPVLRSAADGPRLTPDGRLGATADRYGNWYWIAGGGAEIVALPADGKTVERFWPPLPSDAPRVERGGDFAPQVVTQPAEGYHAIAATVDHYLVVGLDGVPSGLLIFDLFGGDAPLRLAWSSPLSPYDIAAGDEGRVWILDRTRRVVWGLDRAFQVVGTGAAIPPAPRDFAPASPDAAPLVLKATSPVGAPIPLAASVDPVAIEALGGDTFLILDNGQSNEHSVVQCYRGATLLGREALDHSAALAFDTGEHVRLHVRGYDMVFIPSTGGGGMLYVASEDGIQSFAYNVVWDGYQAASLTLASRLLPMRHHTGKGLVRRLGRVTYDFGERWATLAEQQQPRFEPRASLILPAWRGRCFDGKEPGCVWHRLLLDACIPPDAEVAVESRANDDRELLSRQPWQSEPRLYHRADGPELPYYRVPLAGSAEHTGTWEVLLQNATGRYLQLRLRLTGRGRATPVLQALRIYYPRFSYLKEYLPGVYREDRTSAGLLDRYLANPEGLFSAMEGRLDDLQLLFDPRTTPSEGLDWLAGWLGLGLDTGWSVAKRRLFLANAPTLFRERGTLIGLWRAVRVALEGCADPSLFTADPTGARAMGSAPVGGFGVRIVERFRLRQAPGVVFGDPSDVLGPGSSSDMTTWTPAQGAEPLHRQFRAFLAARYSDIAALNAAWAGGAAFQSFDDSTLQLPAIDPGCGDRSADWQAFVRGAIGFVYAAVTDGDEPLYREFLARRYRQPGDINAAYGLSGAGRIWTFEDVAPRLWQAQLHQRLPDGGAMLRDWIVFVSSVLPTERYAHRFSVLVPVTLADSVAEQARKRDIADRVAALEKPAHTAHDVKLYWALFRAGEARVGYDTVLGLGSRTVALTLGRDGVGAAHVGFTDAQRAGRLVVDQPVRGERT